VIVAMGLVAGGLLVAPAAPAQAVPGATVVSTLSASDLQDGPAPLRQPPTPFEQRFGRYRPVRLGHQSY
jgi:hypothetical protein